MKQFITINGCTIPANQVRIVDDGTTIFVYDMPLSDASALHGPLFKTDDPGQMAALRWWIAQNSEDILTDARAEELKRPRPRPMNEADRFIFEHTPQEKDEIERGLNRIQQMIDEVRARQEAVQAAPAEAPGDNTDNA